MNLGWIVAGSALIGIAGVGALGLGTLVTPQIGRAFGMTMEQMVEDQKLADYYNQQQVYYQYTNTYYPSEKYYNRYDYHYYR